MGGAKRGLGTDQTLSSSPTLASAAPYLSAAEDRGGELAAGTTVGEYQIESLLGEGGMGRVYAAIHPVIGKRVAVKVLHPALSAEREAVERFIQEARAVNQIGHPNIVDIFAFGALPDGRCFFVMEQLRGETLGQRVERERLPLLDVLSILDTIAVALDAAHRKGIIHRDLKPDNVYLVEIENDKPQVKLLDFGIAKLVGGDAQVERTRTGNVMGTPAYISPEQARGQNVDHRTDIYAFGAVAFELLTGDLPFPATNAADMLAKHLFEPPRSPARLNPEVDPELDTLVRSMLAKAADQRPSLEEVRERLRACRKRVFQRMALHEGEHTDPVIDVSDVRSNGGEYDGRGTSPLHARRSPAVERSSLDVERPLDPRAPRRRVVLFAGGAAALAVVALVVVIATRREAASPPSRPAATKVVPSEPTLASPAPPIVEPAPPATQPVVEPAPEPSPELAAPTAATVAPAPVPPLDGAGTQPPAVDKQAKPTASKHAKHARDAKLAKAANDAQAARAASDAKDAKDGRDAKDAKDAKDARDAKDAAGAQGAKRTPGPDDRDAPM